MPMESNGVWGDYNIEVTHKDVPEDTEEQWLYEQIEEIVETFVQHLADRLNAKLPGKWEVREID